MNLVCPPACCNTTFLQRLRIKVYSTVRPDCLAFWFEDLRLVTEDHIAKNLTKLRGEISQLKIN